MLYKKTKEYYTPGDALCINISLMLRLFEYVKENPQLTDVEVHKLVDTAKKWNEKYHVLNMDAYQSIITGVSPAY
jgi:hypothetical protein